jgi:hypothetical protein
MDVGAAYLQRTFERDEPENAPDDLPVAAPLSSDDELESIMGRLQQLQFPIGLRYYAWQSGRFQFHIGAGLVPLMDLSSSFSTNTKTQMMSSTPCQYQRYCLPEYD